MKTKSSSINIKIQRVKWVKKCTIKQKLQNWVPLSLVNIKIKREMSSFLVVYPEQETTEKKKKKRQYMLLFITSFKMKS